MTQIVLLLLAGLAFGTAQYFKMRLEVNRLRAYITELEGVQNAPQPAPAKPIATLEPIALPNAGLALKSPPTSLQATLSHIQRVGERYTFPLGWYTDNGLVDLATARFTGDVNHILLTGQSDAGKDNAALNIILSLAATHTPQHVQFAIVDGKGLDWIDWQCKAHAWLVATEPEEISGAMESLTNERKRRRGILADAGVKKWDTYQGDDLPLLVVFVSELLLLQNAVGKANLTSWLNTELTASRAYGIRYIIATQTASNFDTQWRSQISLFLAGFQPTPTQDMPNVGMTTKDLEAIGAVAPSGLPAPANGASGVFLALQGNTAVNVRTSFISDQHGDYWLAQLPQKTLHSTPTKVPTASADTTLLALLHSGQPLPIADELVELSVERPTASSRTFYSTNRTSVEQSDGGRTFDNSRSTDTFATSYVELPLPDDLVPFDEQRRIIEAAQTVKSKRQLSMKLYATDGGQKSTWVKLVCDAVGLLQPTGGA